MTNNLDDYSSKRWRRFRPIGKLLLLAIIYHFVLAPSGALALSTDSAEQIDTPPDAVIGEVDLTEPKMEEETLEPAEILINVPLGIKGVSAYNVGDPNQCDASPCTAANGENICLALELGYRRCAANFVPFGTLLEIEGVGRCLVTDRMHPRFGNTVDIAMKKNERREAVQFGRQRLNISIIKKAQVI